MGSFFDLKRKGGILDEKIHQVSAFFSTHYSGPDDNGGMLYDLRPKNG